MADGEMGSGGKAGQDRGNQQFPAAALPEKLLQGWLLTIIARKPQHGYAIAKEMHDLPFAPPHQTTIYRHLSSLERQGLLDSGWTMRSSAPPIRTYHLTDDGRDHLRSIYGTVSELQRICNSFLDETATYL